MKALQRVLGLLVCMAATALAQEAVTASNAPKPVGPYSHAIKAGEFVFVSGQVAFDPATGKIVSGDIKAQTERTLQNIEAVLKAAGTDADHVVKATVYLRNASDYAAMNEVYAKHFKTPPARSTVQAPLPTRPEALVEIEVIALLPKK